MSKFIKVSCKTTPDIEYINAEHITAIAKGEDCVKLFMNGVTIPDILEIKDSYESFVSRLNLSNSDL